MWFIKSLLLKSKLQYMYTCTLKFTSVSCSRCPIRDRDSPRSCRWAAASMGSTSGTRAGDRETVLDVLFGDTTPVPVPVPAAKKTPYDWTYCKTTGGVKWYISEIINLPLLLLSLVLLCLTVVASALFCLCCRYWAFCLQTCTETQTEHTEIIVQCHNCKQQPVTIQSSSSINYKKGETKPY